MPVCPIPQTTKTRFRTYVKCVDIISDNPTTLVQSVSSVSTNVSVNPLPPHGCPLLQAIEFQPHQDSYSTISGSYLDVIFMHREAFFAFPQGHRTCSVSFSELAKVLEKRPWRTDRDGDQEAVVAFRNEAWVIANS